MFFVCNFAKNIVIMPLLEDGTFVIDDSIHPFDISRCKFCKHFHGKDKGTCTAYPYGIPKKFSIGNFSYWHDKIEKDQTGSFIFESSE